MMPDLLTYLVLDHIERLTSPTLAREQADLGLQLLECMLSDEISGDEERVGSETEYQILQDYLHMSLTEFDSIAPEAHAWLLERLSIAPSTISEESASALNNLYFASGDGFLRHLVLNGLLSLDHPGSQETFVSEIWNNVLRDEAVLPDQQSMLIHELVDILIDIDTPMARQALQILARKERGEDSFKGELNPVAERVGVRAEMLGGEAGARLRHLIGDAGREG